MRLIGVEMAGGEPSELRLPEVVGDPAHDLSRVIAQVVDPIPMLRRDDEAEVVPVRAPALSGDCAIHAIGLTVEELGPGPLLMSSQRTVPRAISTTPRVQRRSWNRNTASRAPEGEKDPNTTPGPGSGEMSGRAGPSPETSATRSRLSAVTIAADRS